MNQEVNIDNKKKKLKVYYGLLVTVLCIIGVSFAWFRLYLSQSENNTLASRTCFNTTLTEDTSKIELTDAFPISDEDGLKQTPFTFTLKNNCDSYVKVYITIDSTYRESADTAYLKDSYLKVNVSPKDTTDNESVILSNQTLTDLESNRKGYIIVNAGLKANEEKSYDLRIWMDSVVTTELGLNKKWAGKIVIVSNAAEYILAPDNWYEAKDNMLLASLRDNNTLKKTLTTPGVEVSAHTLNDVESATSSVSSTYQAYYVTYGTGWKANGTAFDLTGVSVTSDTYANSYSELVGKYIVNTSLYYAGSSTAGTMTSYKSKNYIYYIESATHDSFVYKQITSNKNTTEALLASTEDDYGTSYYFRGAVKNNYVEFANKCWRIVRINGNGSIKLALHNDNTSKVTNPCSLANNSDTAAFARYYGNFYTMQFNKNADDNTYIGFMYGATGASDYASTHANTNKSTILTNLETWYKKGLISYEDKLADTIWCNDKSTFTTFTNGSTYGTGLGYGTNKTGYKTYNRLDLSSAKQYAGVIPSLLCQSDNNGGKLSKFTVSDTTNGNGSLTYKVGLLTADELAFSGFRAYTENSSAYLNENATGTTNNGWWTLSPRYFDSEASFWIVTRENLNNGFVNVARALRPAISLVSDITISGGTGTSEDPYVID